MYARHVEVPTLNDANGPVYVLADLGAVAGAPDADRFFDRSYDSTLASMIAHVVAVEGPVMDAVLARRIARAHGWQRTGARIEDRVSSLARQAFETTEEECGLFYWPGPAGAAEHTRFRSPGEDPRSIDEISFNELTELAGRVLVSHSGDKAVAAMAHELGLGRLRMASRARVMKALAQAENLYG